MMGWVVGVEVKWHTPVYNRDLAISNLEERPYAKDACLRTITTSSPYPVQMPSPEPSSRPWPAYGYSRQRQLPIAGAALTATSQCAGKRVASYVTGACSTRVDRTR
jgi:hypothetical protein